MAQQGIFQRDPALLTPVTLRYDGDCPTFARSHVTVRGHELIFDEPPERDGGDQGAAPTETFAAALIGVGNIILRRLARRDGLAIHQLSMSISATLDRRGVWLAEAVACPWLAVEQTIRLRTDADAAQLAVWQHDLPRFSPLHATLTAAGTEVRMVWERV